MNPCYTHPCFASGSSRTRSPVAANSALTMAGATGGRIEKLEGEEEIVPAFEDILQELREQYVLGYYPEPRYRDGRWREVEVDARVPGVRVRTREGYVDRRR